MVLQQGLRILSPHIDACGFRIAEDEQGRQFHVLPTGAPLYEERYQQVGDFWEHPTHGPVAPVRQTLSLSKTAPEAIKRVYGHTLETFHICLDGKRV